MLAVNAALVTVNIVQNRNVEVKEYRYDKNNKYKQKKHRKHRNFEQHIADKLDFSKEQRRQIEGVRAEFKHQRKEHHGQMSELKQRYFDELSQDKPDTIKLEKLVEEIANLEAQKLKSEYQHYRNIRSICTPNQAVKLDSLGKVKMKYHFKGHGSDKTGRRR